MKSIDNTQLLHKLEEQVEQHIQAAIQHFQNIPEDVLLASSVNHGWSIAQCLAHLNSYGDYYLPAIHRSLKEKTKDHSFVSSWLGAYFKKMMDPSTGKQKFKAFKGHIPPAHLDAHKVVAEFIRQQEVLLRYLREAKEADLNTRIPISLTKWIKLKLGDTFQFLIAHNERHLQQAKRNITK